MKQAQLTILGFTYTVLFQPQQIHDGKDYNWGMCDNEKQIIQVWRGLTPQRQRQVLVHEIIHAIFELMAIEQGNEENVCDCVSLGLVVVLKDNPWLVKWLVKDKQ